MTDRFVRRLHAPVDIASLAAFRIAFGLLMFVGTVRFMSAGWVRTQYVEPDFHFRYFGLSWVPVLPDALQYGAWTLLAVLSLCVAAGLFYRQSIVLFAAVFTLVRLTDVTNYLNHYYLVLLVSALMTLMPLEGLWSVDAWRDPSRHRGTVPAWMLWLLRFQVASVYFFAALAKAGPDWLQHAQPLGIWLSSRTDTPLLGPLFALPWTPFLMSWAGFLYDLTIPLFLLARPTRPFAYLAVLAFHTLTFVLFDIGMFPFIMTTVTLLFFSPEWPRRVLSRLGVEAKAAVDEAPARVRRWLPWALAGWCAVQVLVPLRSHVYGGNVLWHEQGMRFSWRVMVREKSGSVTFRVRQPQTGREWYVGPETYLNPRQASEMSGQPDLILQLAHHIADDFRRRGHGDVQVFADALVSLNGRPPAPMIDPTVDLARVSDGLLRASWIQPAPQTPPLSRPPLPVARHAL